MTVDHARKRLIELGVKLVPYAPRRIAVAQPITARPSSVRRFDETLATWREQARRMRRKEEGFTKDLAEVVYACSRDRIRCGRAITVPLAHAQRVHRIRCEQGGHILPADAPFIERWVAHVNDEARRLGATITWVVSAGGVNAYAFPTRKAIETSPIVSSGSYGKALHELGHVACPCTRAHRPVKATDRDAENCVACELEAWQWAIAHAVPTWSAPMHAEMARCLPSYRSYGTPAEQRAIDHLVSDLSFRRLQLARATKGAA